MKENTETEQRQYIETELGNVLLVNAVIDYNGNFRILVDTIYK